MDHTLRRDPRRPYVVTSEGIRRIVLGASAGDAARAATDAAGESSRHAGAAASSRNVGHGGTTTAKPLRTTLPARDYILAIAFSERGVLDEHPRQAVAAAALLAGPHTAVVVAVLGELTEELASCGADIVLVLPDCELRRFQPEHVLARIAAVLQQYPPAHVLIPDRLNGEGDLGRRLAAAYEASVAAHVVEISPDHVAAYQQVKDSAGKPARRLARRPLTDVILLEPNVVDTRLPFVGAGQRIDGERVETDDTPQHAGTSVAPPPGAAAIRASSVSSPYRDGGLRALEASDLPLEEADLIASAGNGVTDVPLFLRLAKALGAATGASRVAVDDGRFARNKQIGATGKTVSANAYIAIGISGAVQHLQGIKDCRHVIAINRDIAAPIIQRADLSIIGDAQGIMQALLDAVDAARAKGAADSDDNAAINAVRGRAA